MIIAFIDIPVLGIRGTSTVLWGLAHYNETILGNKSIIITFKELYNYKFNTFVANTNEDVIKHFSKRFDVYALYTDEIEDKLKELKIDICYISSGGFSDCYYPKTIPSITNWVFIARNSNAFYSTAISPYVAKNTCPIVPNIIYIDNYEKTNIRKELGIPDNAIVFGRHGGKQTFNIPFVYEVITEICKSDPDIYFVFMNTDKFIDYKLPNLIHIFGTPDITNKTKFINSCDAMIHARIEGETFGCACGEFALCEKPIITSKGVDDEHLNILGDKALIYKDAETLRECIFEFKKNKEKYTKNMKTNRYQEFTPEKVMPIFNEHIQKCLQKWESIKEMEKRIVQ